MTADHVEVRWLATGRVAAGQWPLLRAMLGDAERARADRFHFARDRESYIAAHALVRGMLAAHGGRHPTRWRFTAGPFGKPEVATGPPFKITLTHTDGLAAAAVTLRHDIGIDAEPLSGEVPPEVVDQFASAEQAALRALDPAAAATRFREFWTLKEAHMKAVGRGIDLGLAAAQFETDPIAVTFADSDECPSDWHFRLYRPETPHVVALAVRHPTPPITAAAVDLDHLLATLSLPV